MLSTFHESNATSIVYWKKYAFPSLAALFFSWVGCVFDNEVQELFVCPGDEFLAGIFV